MSRATIYRRSRMKRASFQAKKAFSGVPTGKALASKRGGSKLADTTHSASVPAVRPAGAAAEEHRIIITRSWHQPSANGFDLHTATS